MWNFSWDETKHQNSWEKCVRSLEESSEKFNSIRKSSHVFFEGPLFSWKSQVRRGALERSDLITRSFFLKRINVENMCFRFIWCRIKVWNIKKGDLTIRHQKVAWNSNRNRWRIMNQIYKVSHIAKSTFSPDRNLELIVNENGVGTNSTTNYYFYRVFQVN